MASYDASQEVMTRLNNDWTGILWYPWEKTDPDVGSDIEQMFMLLEFPGGQSTQKSVGAPGNNWWAEVGTFNLHVYYPAGDTADAARLVLQDVAAIFRGVSNDTAQGGSMRYRAPFPPQPGMKSTLSGNWMSLTMAVPYEHRIRG